MKALLFTHEQDIDGMGCILIAKHASFEFDYVTCKNHEVNVKVESYLLSGKIYEYDFIYITDICLKEPLLLRINEDERLKNKFLILDHHKTVLDDGYDKYSFVKVTIQNEKGKASGTSLFYDYLIEKSYLVATSCLTELVELTRQYDTWEWKDKYNNPKARMLHILFEQLGYEQYLLEVSKILTRTNFDFDDYELSLISDFERKLQEVIDNILVGMVVQTLSIRGNDYKIGFIQSLYQYRNDLIDAVRKNNLNDIDLLCNIILDKEQISFRNLKDVDVSIVAQYFGGGGHKEAAGAPKNHEEVKKFLSLF